MSAIVDATGTPIRPVVRDMQPKDVVIQPKRPITRAGEFWRFYDYMDILGFLAEVWQSARGHNVISNVEVAEDEHAETSGLPVYHVSVTYKGQRMSAQETPWFLNQFGMTGADEDNHVGGKARNFFLPVADHLAGFVCPCKEEETAIVEKDYVWRPLD